MAKFKGRSSLKQYLPLKPIKRGIKIWERCDAKTGYTYDLNVYSGRDNDQNSNQMTLGEKVVNKLASTIRNPDITLAFDRFFTSVNLMDTIQYPAVGTCILSRKNMPKFDNKKLSKWGHEFRVNGAGTLASRWMDSKEVVVLSNCQPATITFETRKQKDGTKLLVECPSAISLYNKIMGGIDLADQNVSVYDFNRKSKKWWKKVFYKLLMTAVVNAWIIHKEIHNTKTPLLQFIVPLSERMMAIGKMAASTKRKRCSGRPSKLKKLMLNVGDHLPVEGSTRRRCASCSKTSKKEKRTKTICTMCNVPLCKLCFAPYHS